MRRRRQLGMTLAEVLVGLVILSTMIVATATLTSTTLKLTRNNVNKEFATQKAISMLEELRSLVQVNTDEATLTFLDAYDDGIQNRLVLTTQGQLSEDPPEPGDPASGNVKMSNGWLYERRISVKPVPGQGNDVRFVNVKVFINDESGQRLLAEVASVLRTLVSPTPPTQVYDVYAVAVENVPGWWVYMSNIVPFVRNSISDLEARNPGLVIRTHWISTLSYGRDFEYRPFTNNGTDAVPNPSTSNIPWAYFYPGRLPADAAAPSYYPPFLFRGVVNEDDTTVRNGYSAEGNPWPYALADQFNNAMRYEDELAYYNKRRAANPAEEPTWRLLLEQMYSNPLAFTNAIVINLHGELLPFPPIRNYSDAAKEPVSHPNVRAVTHPEQLRYTNSDAVRLRVHTWLTSPDDAAADDYLEEPVTVVVRGANSWLPSPGEVTIVRGGTDQDGTSGADEYDRTPVTAPTTSSFSDRMYYTAQLVGSDTVLRLYNSPLRHGQVVDNGGGLPSAARLYGLEYVPSPVEDLTVTPVSGQFNVRHLGYSCCDYARDLFGTVFYGNSDGNVSWSDEWTETADDGDPDGGLMRITGSELRLGDNASGDASTIRREVNTSAFRKVRLSFTYRTTNNLEGADRLHVQMSSNGGSTWTTVRSLPASTATVTVSDDVTAYKSATTMVRFVLAGIGSSEYYYVDDVRISDYGTANVPKNTARWIISIPDSAILDNRILSFETRIGDTTASGVMYPPGSYDEPSNLSRTFAYRGSDLWAFGDGATNLPNLPITERFQFLGDPRHCPYADLKRPHAGAGFGATFENALGMGYNRYFDDFESDQDSDGDGASDGNAAVAELIAPNEQNYNIGTTETTFAVIVDGGPTITVTLNSGNQSASTIASKLNSTAAFSAVATADAYDSRLRIRSKNRTHLASIQYDTATGNNEADFGFTSEIAGPWWPGWRYDSGGVAVGVKNDDIANNDNWNRSAESTSNGPSTASYEMDVHRAYQIIRSSLIQSNALWTTMTGYSYYYLAIGGEIGYDSANNFPKSVPISTLPFTGQSGSRFEQGIIPSNNETGPDLCNDGVGCGVKYVRQQSSTGGWWGLWWIGELYPDSQYTSGSDWQKNGNLRAGQGSTYYIRDLREDFPLFQGTDFRKVWRRTGPPGGTTLFWGESATSAFHHEGQNGDGSITTAGTDIANRYELPVPTKIPSNRPWQIAWNASSNNPESFLGAGYPQPHRLQILERYFERLDASSSIPSESSGLVAITEPLLGRPAFVVVNGLSPTGITGTTFISKWSFLTLIQSFLAGGLYDDGEVYSDPDGAGPMTTPAPGDTYHIRQLPRVSITDPNVNTDLEDPTAVTISWSTTWRRWDGLKYTSDYTCSAGDQNDPCYTPDFAMRYIVMYSPSNGAPNPDEGNPTGWFYTDGTPAPLGARNLAKSITTATYDLSTPEATFPEGTYLFRVEAYREGQPLHYSYHQYRAYIER